MRLNCYLTHSHYSFLHAGSGPEELLAAAQATQTPLMALCDFDGVYGAANLHRAHAAQGREAPRVAYGVELRLRLPQREALPPFRLGAATNARSEHAQAPLEAVTFLQERLAFLAPNKKAWAEICRLVTYAHRNGKQAESLDLDDPALPWPQEAFVLIPQRGVAMLVPPGSAWGKARMDAMVEVARRAGGRCYATIQAPNSPLLASALAHQILLHRKHGVPLLATPDVFLHHPASKALLDVMTSIRLNEALENAYWARFPNADLAFPDPAQFAAELRAARGLRPGEAQEALRRNQELEGRFAFSLSELHYRYPSEFLPEGFSAQGYLEHLVHAGMRERYGASPPQRLLELVEKERVLVRDLGFADYFLTVWDVVRYAREQNILCQGRGSAANSALCFLLGITAVDPAVSELVFERFLSRERGEPPDIDVDFEHERREEVIQYIYGRYGRHRAAMVANLVTFRTKGALRAVGKALGLGEAALTCALSVLGDRLAYEQGLEGIIREAAQELARAGLPVPEAEVLSSWPLLAGALKGRPRHLGIHSGGFVMSQAPLDELVPHEPASMEGRSVVQWNKDDLESLGLFKVDILALGMLTALRKTLHLLGVERVCIPGTRLPVTLLNIPPECPKTYEMIRATKTTGVFQIESRAQMAIIPKVQPNCFYDLVVQIGIVRPGPIVSGMVTMYTRRKQGKEPVEFPDERLRPILARTLGVPVFQEQVMRIAVAVGDFSPGEADELRRAMGAWKLSGQISRFEAKLKSGMRRNGIPDDFAERIYQFMTGFSEYGFPESHSTSFAHIAYASSYLKAHFPAAFLCGLLNAQPLGFYSEHSLIQEALHEGVRVEAPCVLKSGWDSCLEGGAVRLGLRLLRGMSRTRLEAFLERRTALLQCHGTLPPVETLFEAIAAELTPPELATFILSNSFRCYGELRCSLLWHALARPSSWLEDVAFRSFGEKDAGTQAWDDLRDDYESSGTSLDAHPIAVLREHAWPYPIPPEQVAQAEEFHQAPHGTQLLVCGMVLLRQAPPTAKGVVFLTIEDATGPINLIFQAHVWERTRAVVTKSGFLCVRGRREDNGGQGALLVREVLAPEAESRLEAEREEAPLLRLFGAGENGKGPSAEENRPSGRAFGKDAQ